MFAVLFLAFNWSFDDVALKAPELAARGFTHVQVSPPQKSLDRPEWWARYQPVDYRVISGPLGDEGAFLRMTEAAHRAGLKVIVDAVLNHMASSRALDDLHFPAFSPVDFHFPDTRPDIVNWNDRREVVTHWLDGLPDLATETRHVRDEQYGYLRKLVSLGADGFRYDAAKHIEPGYFHEQLARLPGGLFHYGEVIGSSDAEYAEYTPLLPVTDFGLLGAMIGAFRSGGDVRGLVSARFLPGDRAVTFARNHDTAMSPGFFNFETPEDAQLGNAFVLARAGGLPCVYRDDASQAAVRAGIAFRRATAGAPERLVATRPDLLQIERGDSALALIHIGTGWFETADFPVPRLRDGTYRELAYGFDVTVATGRITAWRMPGGRVGRVRIGPKTALFLVRQDPARPGSGSNTPGAPPAQM